MAKAPSIQQVPEASSPQDISDFPDFFLLGAAKSGTTSLHHYLRQHPALFLPRVKELDFFDTDEERFASGLDWYLSYFRDEEAALTGEATPLYFRRPDLVAERMRTLYGHDPPRFLLLLRDPVHRAHSHYLHKVSQGTEPLSFEAALDAERTRPQQKRREWKSYFQDGLYARRLTVWHQHFSPDQFLVLLSQDLRQHPQTTLRSIFRFLGVDPDADIDTSARLNRTGEQQSHALGTVLSILPSRLPPLARRWTPESLRLWVEQFVRRGATHAEDDRPALTPSLENTLRRRYEPHVRHLSDVIDRDLSDWHPTEVSRPSSE